MTSLLAPIEATPYVGGTANSFITVDVNGLQVTLGGIDGELLTWSSAGVPATVAAGSLGQVLTSNGAGAAPTFQAAGGGTPGGADTELQYNNGGAFGSLVNVTYNDTSSVITIGFADELSGLVGNGTDIDAGDLTIKVPVSTGNADPGAVIIQTTVAGTTGSTVQTLQDKFRFVGSRMEVLNTGNSVFIGDNAGASDDLTANNNVYIGELCGGSGTTAKNNVAVGARALRDNVTGAGNFALGFLTLALSTGSFNVGIGEQALLRSTTADRNIAIGRFALHAITTSGGNVAIGSEALEFAVNGDNVAIGIKALQNLNGVGANGRFNVAIGSSAGLDGTDANQNTFIGIQAGRNVTTGADNIQIGYNLRAQSATGDSQISIGNLITGNATAQSTTAATGSMGIGTFAFATGTTLGVLCFPDNTADPAPAADTACIYANDIASANVTPFATDEANNVEPLVPFAEAVTLGSAVTTFVADANLVTVTGDAGANTIATITGARAFAGSRVVLLFVDALVTITDDDTHAANSVDLQGAATNFVSADDTTLELIHNGTSWYEISRSVN